MGIPLVFQQNEDGVPHLAYFNKEFNLSFVWSGQVGEPIDICPGGYGEPAVHQILMDTGQALKEASIHDWLAWFRGVCEEWIDTNLKGFSDQQLAEFIDQAQDES